MNQNSIAWNPPHEDVGTILLGLGPWGTLNFLGVSNFPHFFGGTTGSSLVLGG